MNNSNNNMNNISICYTSWPNTFLFSSKSFLHFLAFFFIWPLCVDIVLIIEKKSCLETISSYDVDDFKNTLWTRLKHEEGNERKKDINGMCYIEPGNIRINSILRKTRKSER